MNKNQTGLSVTKIGLTYPSQKEQTLIEINLDLPYGDIGCIMGESGSGKTTLLKAIAGFENIDHGEITLNDKVISSVIVQTPIENRRIGFVFQDNSLFPHLSVKENIAFGPKFGKPSEKALPVDELISMLELETISNQLPSAISGGQQQRTALARAIVNGPDLLLMDEPFASLDKNLRENIVTEIRSLLQEKEITTLVVTHDYSEASTLGDYIGILDQGKIEQWDTDENLYRNPQSIVVAKAVGDGTILDASDYEKLFNIPAENSSFILRPEDIRIDPNGTLTGTIIRRIGRGNNSLVTCRLNQTQIDVELYISSRPLPNIGDILNICIDDDSCTPIP
jgi:iron(III) transport system ATP-binding protein